MGLSIPSPDRRPRVERWPSILRACIEDHLARPFEWGQSDCAFFRHAVRAMTHYDCGADVPEYATEMGAIKALRLAGFESVFDLVRSRFPEIHPSQAIRGDLAFPDETVTLMSPLVIMGSEAVTKGPSGPVVVSRAIITRAFAV